MALTGTYSRNLDEKQRLAVPKRLRDEFTEDRLTSLYVAPGTESSLALYSPRAFEKLAERLAQTSTSRTNIRNYLRLFYARAEKVDLDKQGRIRIPDRLIEFASLTKDLVLLGVHDHVEIWEKRLWEEFLAQQSPDFDEMASQVFE